MAPRRTKRQRVSEENDSASKKPRSSSVTPWKKQETKNLIAIVKLSPSLYQMKSADFKKHDVTSEIWDEIDLKLQKPPGASRERWSYLRAQFRKQHNIYDKGGDEKVFESYEDMKFLIPHLYQKRPSLKELIDSVHEEKKNCSKNLTLNTSGTTPADLNRSASTSVVSSLAEVPDMRDISRYENHQAVQQSMDVQSCMYENDVDLTKDSSGNPYAVSTPLSHTLTLRPSMRMRCLKTEQLSKVSQLSTAVSQDSQQTLHLSEVPIKVSTSHQLGPTTIKRVTVGGKDLLKGMNYAERKISLLRESRITKETQKRKGATVKTLTRPPLHLQVAETDRMNVTEVGSAKESSQTTQKRTVEGECFCKSDSDLLFLHSLLPDIKLLSPADKMNFKMQVQQNLNELLYS